MECEIETRASYLLDIIVLWLWVKNNEIDSIAHSFGLTLTHFIQIRWCQGFTTEKKYCDGRTMATEVGKFVCLREYGKWVVDG